MNHHPAFLLGLVVGVELASHIALRNPATSLWALRKAARGEKVFETVLP